MPVNILENSYKNNTVIIKYLTSYDRSFNKLDRYSQERTISAMDSLLRFFRTRQKPMGLWLKKTYKDYWEIRLDIKNRIIFEFKDDIVNFAYIGDHNGVRAFLKNV